MGAFADLKVAQGASIPDDQKQAFANGVLEIFREGGMFSISYMNVHGYAVRTLEWPVIDRNGICDVVYNWFENSMWENAGLNVTGEGGFRRRETANSSQFDPNVYSNKVGSSSFSDVMLAAYTLKMLLLNGPSALYVEGSLPTVAEEYAQWIAALLPTVNTAFFPDLWQPFAAISDPDYAARSEYWHRETEEDEWDRWCRAYMHESLSCFISAGEVTSVLHGTDTWLQECADNSITITQAEGTAAELFQAVAQNLRTFRENDSRPDSEQLDAILDAWEARCSEHLEPQETGLLHSLIQSLYILDAPAYGAKLLSETYDRSFWDLWHSLPESIRRRHSKTQARAISTSDFFGCRDDDRIPWWTPEKGLSWSEDQEDWFAKLRARHDELVEKNSVVFLRDSVLELLVKMNDERFGRIKCFQSFLDETMADLENPHIQACWQQLAEMINDPDLEKTACSAIPNLRFPFLDNYEHPAAAPRTFLCRRLNAHFGEWRSAASVLLQRYMGLLGNKALRREVLGF